MQHANFAMGSLTLLSVRNVEYQRPGYERANNVREHKVRKIDQARIDGEHIIIQRISLTTVAWYVVHQRPGYERVNVREHKVRKIDQARIDV
jgi:hypothetical protein